MGNIVSAFAFTVLPDVTLANGFLISHDVLDGLHCRALLCDLKGTILWQSRALAANPPAAEVLETVRRRARGITDPLALAIETPKGPEMLHLFPLRTLLGEVQGGLAILGEEEILAGALERVGTGIMVARDGRFVYTNQAALNVLGRARITFWDQVEELPPWGTLASAAKMGRVTSVALADGCTIRVVFHDGIAVAEISRRQSAGQDPGRNMVAEVAHEIRNPLQALSGFIELALGQIQDRAVAGILDQALAEADRLSRLTTDLLTSTGPIPARRVPVALRQAATRAWAMVGLRPEDSIRIDLSGADAVLHVDSDRFEQVLLNLFKNSVEAMEGRGTVRVSARTAGDAVVVRVADDGPGIPESVMEGLLARIHSSKPNGSGLGLFIVRRLMEEVHGGWLAIASGPEGTVVDLRFPRDPEEAR